MVEVWVTNRNSSRTTDVRDVVAFMDLGESSPHNPRWGGSPVPYPRNNANDLYPTIVNNAAGMLQIAGNYLE